MSEESLVDNTVESKPTTVDNVVEEIAETTGVEIENVSIQEATNEEKDNVVKGPSKAKRNPVSNIENKEDGVFRSKAADNSFKKIIETKPEKKETQKVALWSNKNVRWDGIGTLSKGYNIVSKEASEKWLTRNGIRTATPEEVATYYGK